MKILLKVSAGLCVAILTIFTSTANGQIITSGLRLQLDATQIAGLSNGDAVVTWADSSTNSNSFSQIGDPIARPIYYTNGINGLAAVEFGGGDPLQTKRLDLDAGGTGLNIIGDELTIFIALQYFLDTGEQALFGSYGGAGTGYTIYKQPSTNEWNFYGGDAVVGGDFTVDVPTIVTAVKSPSAMSLYQDGSLDNSVSSTNPITSSSNTITLGWSQYNGAPLRAFVGEVLVYDRALTSGEITQVSEYLDAKWVVPEPSTAILAGLGGIAAFLFGGRRRK